MLKCIFRVQKFKTQLKTSIISRIGQQCLLRIFANSLRSILISTKLICNIRTKRTRVVIYRKYIIYIFFFFWYVRKLLLCQTVGSVYSANKITFYFSVPTLKPLKGLYGKFIFVLAGPAHLAFKISETAIMLVRVFIANISCTFRHRKPTACNQDCV